MRVIIGWVMLLIFVTITYNARPGNFWSIIVCTLLLGFAIEFITNSISKHNIQRAKEEDEE